MEVSVKEAEKLAGVAYLLKVEAMILNRVF